MKNRFVRLVRFAALLSLTFGFFPLAGVLYANGLVGGYEYFDAEGKWSSNRSGVPSQRAEGDLQRIVVALEGSVYGAYLFGDLEGKRNNPFDEKYNVYELGVEVSNHRDQHLHSTGHLFGRYTKIEYTEKATGAKAGDEEFYALGFRSRNYYQIYQTPIFRSYQINAGPGLDGEFNGYYTDSSAPFYDPEDRGSRKYGIGGNLRPFLRLGIGDRPRGQPRIMGTIEAGYLYSYYTNFRQDRRYKGFDYRAGLRISF